MLYKWAVEHNVHGLVIQYLSTLCKVLEIQR